MDVTLHGGTMIRDVPSRSKVLDRLRLGDSVFRNLTRAAAIAVLVILGGVMVSLVTGAWPALQAFGFNFLIEERWNPVTERFGAIAPIHGISERGFHSRATGFAPCAPARGRGAAC